MVSELENEFDFDDDENQHYENIREDISETLYLAREASVITINGISFLDNPPQINTPQAMVTFLMLKTGNSIRYAVKGLKLGYYSSVAAVLRSALESLSFAYLFDSNPNEVASWLRNEFSDRDQSVLNRLRNDQIQKAINSMLDLETQPKVIAEVLYGFKKGANKNIHATLVGLAKELNIDIGQLLPNEIAETEGDLNEALDHYWLLTTYGKDILAKKIESDEHRDKDEMVWLQYTNQYIEDEIFDLSIITFYIAHRLLDLTQSFSISDRDFQQNYRQWHKESKSFGKSAD